MPLKITDSLTTIKSKIQQEVHRQLKRKFNIAKLDKMVQELLKKHIEDSSAWQSLRGGQLQIDFGIRQGEVDGRQDSIMESILSTVKVSLRSRGNKVVIEVTGLDDYTAIINNPAGITESNGTTLPWLEWLLFYGDKEIIDGYDVQYTSSVKSRSGGGIMIQSNKSFSVDPEFAGYANSNFITKAIDKIYESKDIEKFFIGEINRVFQ